MIKTKMFLWFNEDPRPDGKKIDEQINDFIEKNKLEIVDVKLAVSNDFESSFEIIRALLLYKEGQGET